MLRAGAQDKKGGFHLFFLQDRQNLRRDFVMGAVIDGQGHHFVGGADFRYCMGLVGQVLFGGAGHQRQSGKGPQEQAKGFHVQPPHAAAVLRAFTIYEAKSEYICLDCRGAACSLMRSAAILWVRIFEDRMTSCRQQPGRHG